MIESILIVIIGLVIIAVFPTLFLKFLYWQFDRSFTQNVKEYYKAKDAGHKPELQEYLKKWW